MTVRKKERQLDLPLPRLRDLNQVQYVNRRGEICPSCGNDQKLGSTYPLEGPENGVLHRGLFCPECDASWTEQFIIAGYANFRSGAAKNDKAARRKARRLARKNRA